MTDRWTREKKTDSEDDPADAATGQTERTGVASTEAYEQDGRVVLYDAENPLAWIEADSAVAVERMA